MALGSTQPVIEISTRSISWGKGGLCVRLTTLPPSCAVVMKSESLNFLEPSGPLWTCNGIALPYCVHSFGIKEVIDCKSERSGKLQNYGFVFVIVLLWIIRDGMHVRVFTVFVGKSLMSLNTKTQNGSCGCVNG